MATESAQILKAARIAPEIFQLRPDYRALLLVVDGIPSGPSDTASETLLREAENHVRELLTQHPIPDFPHIAAWREAYKSFGTKPNKTRNSLEALSRRVVTAGAGAGAGGGGGLPRVNRLTDIYNAISVKHQIPLGGEDLDKYEGAPFLIRAAGDEPFQTFSGGEPQTECAAPGEPIWCDGKGVTCRRWNWRQGPRTALTDDSRRVLFILDALEPLGDDRLVKAAEELAAALKGLSTEVQAEYRILGASGLGDEVKL